MRYNKLGHVYCASYSQATCRANLPCKLCQDHLRPIFEKLISAISAIEVIVINRRRGLYWFYKREARIDNAQDNAIARG